MRTTLQPYKTQKGSEAERFPERGTEPLPQRTVSDQVSEASYRVNEQTISKLQVSITDLFPLIEKSENDGLSKEETTRLKKLAGDVIVDVRKIFKQHLLCHKEIERNREKEEKQPTFKKCLSCGAVKTPEWRRGPEGPRTLCNACGLKITKRAKKKKQTEKTNNTNSGKKAKHTKEKVPTGMTGNKENLPNTTNNSAPNNYHVNQTNHRTQTDYLNGISSCEPMYYPPPPPPPLEYYPQMSEQPAPPFPSDLFAQSYPQTSILPAQHFNGYQCPPFWEANSEGLEPQASLYFEGEYYELDNDICWTPNDLFTGGDQQIGESSFFDRLL